MAGRVVQGKGRGAKLLGVPTANILTPNELLPACGIYAVWVRRGDAILPGVANIGTCPTFDNRTLPGSASPGILRRSVRRSLGVHFVTRLREEQRFPSIEALAAQIHADIAAARKVLARGRATFKTALSWMTCGCHDLSGPATSTGRSRPEQPGAGV